MSVRLTHSGLPTDMTPYHLKRFLKRARVSLGLSKGAIEYLVFAIDNCQKSDFLQGRICAIWHSLERLSQIFGLSKRQVGRIEAELVDAGLIRRTYPERKSRSGDRVDGVIKRAAGIEAALFAKGGHGAANELKALKPLFHHLKKLRIISKNPAVGVELDTPPIKGFPTTNATEVEAFINRWQIGTRERLIFDLGLFTGAARTDLCQIGRHNIQGNLLTFRRGKSGVETHVPITADLKTIISRTPDIAPAFILTDFGKPYSKEGLGDRYGKAARAAGIESRLHGLRKAFCVYWAENGKTTQEIMAMSGHLSLSEVERYTKAADRKRIIQLIAGAA